MSIAGAVAKLFVVAAGEVLLDVAKRAVEAAKQRLTKPKPAIVVPPPISADKHLDGLLGGIDRERSRALGDEMTERARTRLEDWRDDS